MSTALTKVRLWRLQPLPPGDSLILAEPWCLFRDPNGRRGGRGGKRGGVDGRRLVGEVFLGVPVHFTGKPLPATG